MMLFAGRNLKVFFRDRAAVFFSLLSVIVIIGLYVLFLGKAISGGLAGIKNARFLMDSWIMAGILAVASLTTTLGAAGAVIADVQKGIAKDFKACPLKRSALVGGYLGGIVAVGVIMTTVALILAELYIVVNGGHLLSPADLGKAFLLIVLAVLASSSLIFFIVSWFQTQNAFGVASTVIGTMVGFLMGIYIPIGDLPESVQLTIKLFPISHAGVLLRQVLMKAPMAQAFEHAPVEVIQDFQTGLGVCYRFGEQTLSAAGSIAILGVTALVFFALGVWRMLKE